MERTGVEDQPDLPDYAGACISNIVPALLEPPAQTPSWLPAVAAEARQVVLLVLDGLGWDQLQERRHIAPTLAAMAGGFIRTVAPSTTAAALTSIATGLPPGEHGVIGYRVAVGTDVLNILRWTTANGDQRRNIVPEELQKNEPFLGHRPPATTRADFAGSGFTRAHLRGVRHHGYRVTSTMLVDVRNLLRAGEPFVYSYYEGIDKVAHEYGLGEHYDAELAYADRLVGDLIAQLPPGAALVVTADHGQVEVGDNIVELHRDVTGHVAFQSGEGRFRWLHARAGRTTALLEAARECHGRQAWVHSRDELIDAGWFGPVVTGDAQRRLGDVALVARGTLSFFDPHDSGPFKLIGRHGSLTPAEMRVPLVAAGG
jgi:hypothetical protein